MIKGILEIDEKLQAEKGMPPYWGIWDYFAEDLRYELGLK